MSHQLWGINYEASIMTNYAVHIQQSALLYLSVMI